MKTQKSVIGAVRKAVLKAFARFRANGGWAKPKWQCCQGCGFAALPKKTKKVAFWNKQGDESFRKGHDLYISHGHDAAAGWELVALLREQGLVVKWAGDTGKTIEVLALESVHRLAALSKVYVDKGVASDA